MLFPVLNTGSLADADLLQGYADNSLADDRDERNYEKKNYQSALRTCCAERERTMQRLYRNRNEAQVQNIRKGR